MRDWLQWAAAQLRAVGGHGAESPFLDATLLIATVRGEAKERTLAALPETLAPAQARRLEALVARRGAGEPLAYIRGFKEFYGRRFAVDDRVLIPRPETELLIDLALSSLPDGPLQVLDLGTGSGAVAITLALERPYWAVAASDISADALRVCDANAAALGATLASCEQADLLPAAGGPWRLIVANLPYVPSAEYRGLAAAGWPEPALALDGGPDGLDQIRRLLPGLRERLAADGLLLLEIGADQGATVAAALVAAGLHDVEVHRDLAGRPRVAAGRV